MFNEELEDDEELIDVDYDGPTPDDLEPDELYNEDYDYDAAANKYFSDRSNSFEYGKYR